MICKDRVVNLPIGAYVAGAFIVASKYANQIRQIQLKNVAVSKILTTFI